MIKDIVLDDRFQQLLKEAGIRILDAGTGMNIQLLRDIYVVVKMLKEGYPLREVVKALKKAFMNRTGSTDPKAANLYADKVLGRVNDHIKRESKDDISKVSEEIERHLATDNLRLKEKGDAPLSLNQKGNILARMMIVDGFSPSAVEEAASQSKELAFENAEELKLVMSSCKAIAERYKAIEETALKTPVNSYGDMYRQYAKAYLQSTGTPFLTPQDDEKILATLCMEIRSAAAKRLAFSEKGRKQLDEYMKLEILPGCSKAVVEASPVAAEGWRSKASYMSCVMHGTEHFAELMKDNEEKYSKTQGLVQDFFSQFDSSQQEAYRLYPETSLDTQLAKELLFERQSEPLIKRAVEENTRVSGRGSFISRNFDDNKQDYARAIMDGARESYNREQTLLYREKPQIPQLSYDQLREQDISASDLYVEAVKEKLEHYPTFRLHMSDPAVDEELTASIIAKHPDVDFDELKEAISNFSPRAAILGIPDDYASNVVEHARNELDKVGHRERQVQTQKMLFNKSRGFAQEAFSEDPMEDYQNCKVAIDMLQDNIPEIDVRQMIKDIAPQDGSLKNPEMYAAMIVSSAKRVIERCDNIEAYHRDPNVSADIKDLYMEKAKKILDRKGFADSNMDVEVYKELKLAGCEEVDIQTAIRNYSPSAMEAGRDEAGYCDFVKASADFKLREEQEKLENYMVIPRLEEECTPDEEYEFQRKKMTDYISLPYSPAFDTKIARGLLEKDVEEGKVADILDRLSPLAGIKQGNEPSVGYGRSRVQEALQGMLKRVLVNEEVKEETKVTKTDLGLVKTRELTRTQTWAAEPSDDA